MKKKESKIRKMKVNRLSLHLLLSTLQVCLLDVFQTTILTYGFISITIAISIPSIQLTKMNHKIFLFQENQVSQHTGLIGKISIMNDFILYLTFDQFLIFRYHSFLTKIEFLMQECSSEDDLFHRILSLLLITTILIFIT